MDCLRKITHPIYIVSKGRHENPLTAKALMREGIPFRIAVEPQEYEQYCLTIPREFVAKLPFSNLGLGSYPARNWCWEDSLERGAARHFLFDDNIRSFYSFNHGKRLRCTAVEALSALEVFTEKFSNVAISGYQYTYFVTKQNRKPFTINYHIYSGMLINNKIPHRWRMKYNEDVDLCLQVLHDKWCTILLNAFLIEKMSTVLKMKGGNQDELYKGNATEKKILKTRSLEVVWPQYAETKIRFGRPHHYVDWRKHFPHALKRNQL